MFLRDPLLPAHLMFGNPPNTKRELNVFVRDKMHLLHRAFIIVRKNISDAQIKTKAYYDKKMHGPSYKVGQKVWLYNPFRPLSVPRKFHTFWIGPFEIVSILNDQTFKIKSLPPLRDVVKFVHYNKLKPFYEKTHSYQLRSRDTQYHDVARPQALYL